MSKIERFDRKTAKAVGLAVIEAVNDAVEELGLVATQKPGTFDAGSFTMKIELATVDENGDPRTHERTDFVEFASLFNLEPEDYGREFVSDGRTLKIVGLKPRNRSYPIIVEDVNTGKRYKFRGHAVEMALRLAKAS